MPDMIKDMAMESFLKHSGPGGARALSNRFMVIEDEEKKHGTYSLHRYNGRLVRRLREYKNRQPGT